MRPRHAAIVVALVTGAAILGAQGQTFKSGASTVAVYTTVTDANGRLVPDLTQDRFEVTDNGKPQTISVFANTIQPITVVMLLDRSGSMRSNFTLVQKAAGAFVNALLPADKARIGSFSNRIEIDPQAFTSDRDEMVQILSTELQEAGPTPLWNALGVGMTAVLHQEGRRVVLVFTDGMDNPMNGSVYNLSLKDVSRRAEQEDVMVYAIGLAGHNSFGGGYGGYGGGYRSRGGGGRRREDDKPDPGLEKIAAASGGGYFELTSTNDLESTFAKVADELHHQYLLGFAPQKNDGKTHALDVRVSGTGLTARARKSYVAPRSS